MRKLEFGILIVCYMLGVACADERKPSELIPELEIYAAKEVTRTSAILSGSVSLQPGVTITSCGFICRTPDALEQDIRTEAKLSNGQIEAFVDGLKAGTTYTYYLEVSNGYSKTGSRSLSFTTEPNTIPVLGDAVLIGQGPISITVQCTLSDDGGLDVETGFRFTETATGQVHEMISMRLPDGVFSAKKLNLNQETKYTVYAYAFNGLGEVHSPEIAFETSNTAYVLISGTLKEYIEGDARYQLTALSVSGFLNGTDIRFLRDLCGRDMSGGATPGCLKSLDLYDAEIVEGGVNYWESRYTTRNTLGYGMFKDCNYLEEFILPQHLEVIEKNALEGCSSLAELHLPSSVTGFTPSDGCTLLHSFGVSPLNIMFSSAEGVLYDKSGGQLLAYPEGKRSDVFTIPSAVHTVGEYAFRASPIRRIEMPHTVKTLKASAFFAAQVEEVVLSNAVSTIPYAAFQSCSRLARVTLGVNTDLLSEYCFDGCPLTDIYVLADYPPTCRPTAFSPSIFANAVVHVLPGCKNLYRSSTSWQNFGTIKEDADQE